MRCPNDEATLVMSERGGIEIDYCPECRGIWLDRGELDKLIERSAEQSPAPWQPEPQSRQVLPQQQWGQQPPAGSSGGLGAVAERLMGEVQRRSQGHDDRRDPRYDDRRDSRYPRYDERRDGRYDDRRRKGGWLGEILG